MKLRPALKNYIYFMKYRTWKADTAKTIITCENNYSRFCFSKRSIIDVWQGSKYASGSEYPSVLHSPRFWMCLWFWMSQTFRYIRVPNMPQVLNMPGFWIYQSSEYTRFTQASEYTCIIPEYVLYLIMAGYVWICRNMPEYGWICLNLPEWLLFYISPFLHLFYSPFSAWWTCSYLFQRI